MPRPAFTGPAQPGLRIIPQVLISRTTSQVSIECWQVSAQYLDLVANLTPPGRRYLIESPSEHRERLVLYVLAHQADDDGHCTASVNDIAAWTTLTAPMARAALHALETEYGFVTISRSTNAPNVYSLHKETLKAKQFLNLLRSGEPSVELLSVYGLDVRSINALRRGRITTLAELGDLLGQYRLLAATDLSLHRFLDIRGLGARSAHKIVTSYAAWQAEADGRSAPAADKEGDEPARTGEPPPQAVAHRPESLGSALR
jgi:hypothetical protein